MEETTSVRPGSWHVSLFPRVSLRHKAAGSLSPRQCQAQSPSPTWMARTSTAYLDRNYVCLVARAHDDRSFVQLSSPSGP